MKLGTRLHYSIEDWKGGVDRVVELERRGVDRVWVSEAYELERKMIGQRTSDALETLKANGQRFGRPVEQADEARQRIAAEHAEGRSLRSIAEGLNTNEVPTARGCRWHASTIRLVLDSLSLAAEAAA